MRGNRDNEMKMTNMQQTGETDRYLKHTQMNKCMQLKTGLN